MIMRLLELKFLDIKLIDLRIQELKTHAKSKNKNRLIKINKTQKS